MKLIYCKFLYVIIVLQLSLQYDTLDNCETHENLN